MGSIFGVMPLLITVLMSLILLTGRASARPVIVVALRAAVVGIEFLAPDFFGHIDQVAIAALHDVVAANLEAQATFDTAACAADPPSCCRLCKFGPHGLGNAL